MIIYGVDPGFANVGLAVAEGNNLLAVGSVHTDSKERLDVRVKRIVHFYKRFFDVYPPEFVIVEDIDYRKGAVSRYAQAYLMAGITLLISVIPEEAGYVLVNKRSLYKVLNFHERKESLKRYNFIVSKVHRLDREHIADSLALVDYLLAKENKKIVAKSVEYFSIDKRGKQNIQVLSFK